MKAKLEKEREERVYPSVVMWGQRVPQLLRCEVPINRFRITGVPGQGEHWLNWSTEIQGSKMNSQSRGPSYLENRVTPLGD